MIRYILVDDDPSTLEFVKRKIDTIAEEFNLLYINSYSSPTKAVEEVYNEDYDLLIVDFDMPVLNGIELSQKIGINKKIIFLTSTINNGPKMMNALEVSGYLTKPFDIEEFKDIVKHKIIGKIKITTCVASNNLITVQVGSNKDVRFAPEKTYYISTSRNFKGDQPVSNCVHFYGKNDEVLFRNVRKNISALYDELKDNNFEKINQSTLINMSHIRERDNTIISLFDSKETFEITSKEKLSFIAKLRAKLNV